MCKKTELDRLCFFCKIGLNSKKIYSRDFHRSYEGSISTKPSVPFKRIF